MTLRTNESHLCKPVLRFDQGTLTLSNVGEPLIAKLFASLPWVFDSRSGHWRVDAFHYAAVSQSLQSSVAGGVNDEVFDQCEIPIRDTKLNSLRDDQQRALQSWTNQRRGVVVMPTGTGKTEVALHAICQTKCSVLVVSPVRDLMYQWHSRILAATGIDAGIIGDGVYRVSPICVTTYDSASIHMARLGNRFRFLILDECHHLPGPLRADAARMSAAEYRLGLTATPERRDGQHHQLQSLIGPTVYRQDIADARGKTLAEYDVIRIAVHLSQEERNRYQQLGRIVREHIAARRQDDPSYDWQTLCKESGDDPEARKAMKAFHAKRSIEDRAEEKLRILEDLFRLHVGEPIIIFCGSNAMARDISLRFLVPCLLSHCRKRERQEILSGMREGRYLVLVANRVLDEGVDLPEVNVAIVVGGGSGTRQAVQRLGRVVRKNKFGRATFYEIVTADTRDEERSRSRRRSDAFRRQ